MGSSLIKKFMDHSIPDLWKPAILYRQATLQQKSFSGMTVRNDFLEVIQNLL